MPAALGSIEDVPPGSLRLISGRVDLPEGFHPERHAARGATGDGTTTELRLVLQRLAEVTEKVEHLTRAISRRDVIERAAGMLMERYGLTGEQALELLVATSSASNSKLAAVAAHLTATGVLEQPLQP
ncbi:ANTAR domain-containing protein [Arthrobacter sp. MDT1-48-3]